MCKVSVVILNYMTYNDTIRCIESIKKRKLKVEGIVVVDNDSPNDSYQKLNHYFYNMKDIFIIKAKKNYGFAKGNNIGIQYARKEFGTNYFLLLNSDTIICDELYLTKMLSQYKEKIGIIGSKIILPGNKSQYWEKENISLENLLKNFINMVFLYYSINIKFSKVSRKENAEWIHGCTILLTPDYFKHYKRLYSYTFLYAEEHILAILLKKANLSMGFAKDTFIYHAGGQSAKNTFQNYEKNRLKYIIRSYKHVLLVKILPYNILKKII